MIIDEKIEVKISSSNFNYFKNKGYIFYKCGDIIIIKTTDLNKGSNLKIKCKCHYCGIVKESSYKNYIQQTKHINKYSCANCSHIKRIESVRNIYGVDYTLQVDTYKEKRKITNIEKYGCEYPISSSIVRDKIKNTNLEKRGVENVFQSNEIKDKIKETNIKKEKWVEDYQKFDSYRRRVKTLTNKIKHKIYDTWNGYDYYDQEYIIDNLNPCKNSKYYPTIDHKISIFRGFLDGISPEEISDIKNICITKRFINSSKNRKIESEFKAS